MNSRNLSDAEALALFRQAGCGWTVDYYPPRQMEDGWYSVHLTVRIDEDDTLYFYGHGPTLGRAVLKAMIKATRWAITGEYRR